MDSGPLGRGSEYRTADFVESKAGALKPKHCETDVADSVSEEGGGGGGGAQVGPRKLPLAGRNRRPPSILCSGRDIGLAPLSLKDGRCTFSRGGQQEKCIFPLDAFQRKRMWPAFSMGGGAPIGGILRATSLYTVNAGRQFTAGPCILLTRGTRRTLINCDQWEASVGCNDYGLTGSLLDHARGTDSFVCVFLHWPSY